MPAMSSIADAAAAAAAAMPRFEDGSINLQELLRRLAKSVVNEIMDAEADQLCWGTGNSRNGYRERRPVTCVGTLALRIPKLRSGSFFPDDVLERCRRVDRALVAAVAEMCATGTSTRKARRVAEAMGSRGSRRTKWAPYARAWTPRSRSWRRDPWAFSTCPACGWTPRTSSAGARAASRRPRSSPR